MRSPFRRPAAASGAIQLTPPNGVPGAQPIQVTPPNGVSPARSIQVTQPDRSLVAERERLTERFALMQSELGGLFYEMAIRDHIRMDVLIPKAAALQRIDGELGQIERMLEGGEAAIGGRCPSCDSVYARGAAFCAQCAHPVTQS